MQIPAELTKDEAKLRADAAAVVAAARLDEGEAKSWLALNWKPAVAIAVSFSIVFVFIGIKIGELHR